MQRLGQIQLHEAMLDALGVLVASHSYVAQKPLELDLRPPLPGRLRVYLYNATRPPGGRPTGEHKVQPIVPGQARGQRGNFDYSDGRIVVLAGYQPELEVFVLWDAGVYRNFSYSRNIQVKGETLYAAYAGQVAVQERRTKAGVEYVVAAHKLLLSHALAQRMKLSLERLLGMPYG